jgi:exopolyphosphatase / guanosine-5'-triphosphate,3'-diphosphate pyrophosphatase
MKRTPEVLAAVDLGSNSFHMVVARYHHGQLAVIDRLREMVRLASGLEKNGDIDKEVATRALACLERFGQRLRDMHADNVRVVGTSALRVARQKKSFLVRAQDALGHPIEIISGVEEARLIYSGVSHSLPAISGRRLVIDIGGGSTELIIGEAFSPIDLQSLKLGCVSFSENFFPNGKVTAKRMTRARVAVRLELEPIQAAYRQRGWQEAVGSSGSVRAVTEALQQLEVSNTVITARALQQLVKYVVENGAESNFGLKAMDPDRRAVFPGGLAILAEIVEALKITELRVAEGAMREGLLYDMVGRLTNEDARERTVRAMQQRYHVDVAQAERVEHTACNFLMQVRENWVLQAPLDELLLRWAARLHEIGLDVSHSGYHRHAAYLLKHADMLGFPHEEQQQLALLVGSHRRRLVTEPDPESQTLFDQRVMYLTTLLRLAVLLHRGRSSQALPRIDLQATAKTLVLNFPTRWLKEQPLTATDLQREVLYLKAAGLRLRIFSRGR